MADTFLELEQQDAAKDLTHAAWLGLLLDREITNRATKRAQIGLRAARLRYSQAAVEDVITARSASSTKPSSSSSRHAGGLLINVILWWSANVGSEKPG